MKNNLKYPVINMGTIFYGHWFYSSSGKDEGQNINDRIIVSPLLSAVFPRVNLTYKDEIVCLLMV
jgi:hypothetical protein